MDSGTDRKQGEADAYWRRRVYVLAGGITVIGLVAWACSGSGHKRTTAQVRNAAVPASPAMTVTPLPGPTTTVTVTATPTAAPAPATKGNGDACDARDLVADLASTRDTYRGGEHPQFRLSVVNTGRRSCAFDVGAKALRLRIESGSDRIWSSDRCGGPASDLRMLRRGIPYIETLEWNRKRCDGDSRARPGTYVISAKGGGVRAKPQVFRLR
jgi:hypothetical protein